MKEQKILSVIKSIIGDKYIGDDCAYIKDLDIVITQDSLVEGVHFDMSYTTPFKLGYKSAMVNISDIAASGGVPEYMTAAISLPKDITVEFVEEFYKGLSSALSGVKVVGGDITSSDKIMISATVIGTTENRRISSRAGAKTGYVIVTSGVHGSSAGGLRLLSKGKNKPENLINAHLMPEAQLGFAKQIAENIKEDYAMMDSSDGLADALLKIADASSKTIMIDFDRIKFDSELKTLFPEEYKDLILYGGEDYQIVGAIPEALALKIPDCIIIGCVKDRENNISVKINIDGKESLLSPEKCYNHFKK